MINAIVMGPVRFMPHSACDTTDFAPNEILVGLDFMHAFNYVFDYPDGIIVMTPRKNY